MAVQISRRRRGGPRAVASAPPSRWRRTKRTIDSFGGLLVIGSIVAALVAVIAIITIFRPTSPSDDPLLGEAIQIGPATHVAPSAVLIENVPQAGGPHASSPLSPGTYDATVAEPQAIHSLEHGIVWLTHQPDLLSEDALERLTAIANDLSRDVLLSPRPENVDAIVLVSWGRRLVMSELDEALVADFVRTNRNRSPEPGIR